MRPSRPESPEGNGEDAHCGTAEVESALNCRIYQTLQLLMIGSSLHWSAEGKGDQKCAGDPGSNRLRVISKS